MFYLSIGPKLFHALVPLKVNEQEKKLKVIGCDLGHIKAIDDKSDSQQHNI